MCNWQNCRAVTSPKKQTDKFVFLSWWLGNTWNLKLRFKFHVFPSHQDRKTNLSICYLGEVEARQFCFEIYWTLRNIKTIRIKGYFGRRYLKLRESGMYLQFPLVVVSEKCNCVIFGHPAKSDPPIDPPFPRSVLYKGLLEWPKWPRMLNGLRTNKTGHPKKLKKEKWGGSPQQEPWQNCPEIQKITPWTDI